MEEEMKKIGRKMKRFATRLKASKGINCTDTPRPNIILCNVGQATGLVKDNIHALIKEVPHKIELLKFIAEKGETYSYLVFSNSNDAIIFYNQFNGKAKVNENGPPLIMNFVENVPDVEIICKHENPKGLKILDNFISTEEECILMKLFDFTESEEYRKLRNRQVRHYGYEFSYKDNSNNWLVNLELPKIPDECDLLWNRLNELDLNLGKPDQLTVNKYEPGEGIPSHVDSHSPFGDTIMSLSLGSSVVMDWRHHSGKYVPVSVPARSLLIMTDESRYDWYHGIQPRLCDPVILERTVSSGSTGKIVKVITNDTVPRQKRMSLTFRWTRRGPCECAYKTLCDTV